MPALEMAEWTQIAAVTTRPGGQSACGKDGSAGSVHFGFDKEELGYDAKEPGL